MKIKNTFMIMLAMFLFISGGRAQAVVQIEKPVTETRSALAITYPENITLSIKFQGTDRLPKSSGEAKVERKKEPQKSKLNLMK